MDSSIRSGLSFQGLGLLELIPQDLVLLINQEIVDLNIWRLPARSREEIAVCINEMKIFWNAPAGTPPDQMIEGVIDVKKFARWAGENKILVEQYLEKSDFTNALPYLEDLEFKSDCNRFDLLATCRNVKRLNCSRCSHLTNTDLQHIKELTGLKELNLSSCEQLTDEGLEPVEKLTGLTSLNLGYCAGLANVNVMHLTPFTKLNSLNLAGSDWVTDKILGRIGQLTTLNSLNLAWSQSFTDEGLGHVAQLTRVNFLNLNLCEQLTSKSLDHLTKLTRLNFLDLVGCDGFTRADLRLMANNLTNLTTLKSNWG